MVARQLDVSHMPLPGFLVIGAQRGGTTSFYDALTQKARLAELLASKLR